MHLKMNNSWRGEKGGGGGFKDCPILSACSTALLDAIKILQVHRHLSHRQPVSDKILAVYYWCFSFYPADLHCSTHSNTDCEKHDQVLRRNSNQTFSNEKTQLLRENQKLQNQLTEQNRETKTQMAIVQAIATRKRRTSSQKPKAANRERTLRRQLNTQRSTPDPLPRNDAAVPCGTSPKDLL